MVSTKVPSEASTQPDGEWLSLTSAELREWPTADEARLDHVFSAFSHSGAFVATSMRSLGAAVHSFWSSSQNPAIQIVMNTDEAVSVKFYEKLSRAIDTLADLDEDNGSHIDQDSAQTGHGLIEILKRFGVSPPQIFSHGGDSLVFKWDSQVSTRYITTASATARLREYSDSNPDMVCTTKFDLTAPDQVFNLVTMLGGNQWKVAVSERS